MNICKNILKEEMSCLKGWPSNSPPPIYKSQCCYRVNIEVNDLTTFEL